MSMTTYRGRTLDEVLPKIREDLGPDAIVVRQRTGLTGGVAGFFQRECVEVEARPAGARIDVYDEEPAPGARATGERPGAPPIAPGAGRSPIEEAPELRDDRATRDGLAAPAVRRMIEQAQPFAERLQEAAQRQPAPLVAGRRRPAEAAEIERELVAAGMRPELAASAVAETVSHLLPFAMPDRLRPLVRDALARRIRVLPGWAGIGRALAFVGAGGSGKTSCVAGVAAAYAGGSDLPVVCLTLMADDDGAALRGLLAPTGIEVWSVGSGAEARARTAGVRGRAVVVVDTPPVSTLREGEVALLARELSEVGLYEVHLALPATLSGPAAREQSRAFGPLRHSRIALTHADETDHVGPVLDLAMAGATPLSFVAPGPDRLVPADARALAARLLP